MNEIQISCSSPIFPYIPDEFYHSEELKKAMEKGTYGNLEEIKDALRLMSVMYWHITFYIITDWTELKVYRSEITEIEDEEIGEL